MPEMKLLSLKSLESQLYSIDFLPRPAEIKLWGLIVVTDIDLIKNQVVDPLFTYSLRMQITWQYDSD
jgi:hypothetical protein